MDEFEIRTFLFLLCGLSVTLTQAETAALTFKLTDVESASLNHSARYQAAGLDYQSAQARAGAQGAQLSPKLSLEASYRHLSEVPSFQTVPNGPAIRFGDNKNYSFGPQLTWTAFASGSFYNRWKSMEAAARAKYFEWEGIRRQILLEARMDYFQVSLALEQVRLLSDSVRLAESQYRDISLQRKAGTVSRIDELTSHQQLLQRARELRQAEGDLAAAIRNLVSLTGGTTPLDLSIPMDNRMRDLRLPESEPPTVFVAVDDIGADQARFRSASRSPDLSHPNIESLTESARSARLLAESLEGGHGPSVQLLARVSRDYPNGPILESIHQKTLGVNASWSLFEAGRVVKENRAQTETAAAAEKRRDQAATDLERDWNKTQDALRALYFQDGLNRRLVEETESLAKLTYDSYRAGQIRYLDVDAANLKLLEAKTAAARTKVQILMQLAILDSLSTPVDGK